MTPEYMVYLNGYYFDSLASSDIFGDRPEPYRQHERSLWTIYQLLRLGEHEVTIIAAANQPVLQTNIADDFQVWLQQVYPEFSKHVQLPIYTRFPHPDDQL
jgi:hypothetical protein